MVMMHCPEGQWGSLTPRLNRLSRFLAVLLSGGCIPRLPHSQFSFSLRQPLAKTVFFFFLNSQFQTNVLQINLRRSGKDPVAGAREVP